MYRSDAWLRLDRGPRWNVVARGWCSWGPNAVNSIASVELCTVGPRCLVDRAVSSNTQQLYYGISAAILGNFLSGKSMYVCIYSVVVTAVQPWSTSIELVTPMWYGPDETRYLFTLQHDGSKWRDFAEHGSKWRDSELSGAQSRCKPATLLARPTSYLVRTCRGAIRLGSHHVPANQVQLRGVATPPPASSRGGRHYNFTTRSRALRPAESRAGTPVVRLTRTARDTAPLAWGNGRSETIAVPPASQGTGTRPHGRLSSPHLVQSPTTARTSHALRPDWEQSGCSRPSRGRILRGHSQACHNERLPCDARQHSRACGANRGALAPSCLTRGATNPQALAVQSP